MLFAIAGAAIIVRIIMAAVICFLITAPLDYNVGKSKTAENVCCTPNFSSELVCPETLKRADAFKAVVLVKPKPAPRWA